MSLEPVAWLLCGIHDREHVTGCPDCARERLPFYPSRGHGAIFLGSRGAPVALRDSPGTSTPHEPTKPVRVQGEASRVSGACQLGWHQRCGIRLCPCPCGHP